MQVDSRLDSQYMLRALQLAENGRFTTCPNPRVGCVIVSAEGVVVGEGFHQRAGCPHAEILALEAAGDQARGGTAYVSLEPCNHYGRTAPCTVGLINAGVKAVVYGMEDPNPRVNGAGLEQLRRAGIGVRGPVQELAALDLNRGYCKRMRSGMPEVRCKLAMSLDGRTAMADGKSKWITSPAAREDVQKLRASACAIITGVGTVLQDDPALSVRLPNFTRQPIRVVVDSRLRSSPEAEIFKAPGKVILACAEPNEAKNPFSQLNAQTLCFPNKNHSVDLAALLRHLAQQEECNDVMIEAGPILSGAFLAAGLLDEIVIYMAAKLMGKSARPLFDLAVNSMTSSLPLVIRDIRAVGDNWRIVAVPDPEG